jgi:hypothetical protein
VDVRGREPKESESSIDQQVLAAIVFDQSVSMVPSVVLDDEARRGVVKVRPADESIPVVAEIDLDFWAWQARLDKQPPKPGLHWRFGRCRHRSERSQLSSTHAPIKRQPLSHCHIHRDQHFDGGPSKGQVAERST